MGSVGHDLLLVGEEKRGVSRQKPNRGGRAMSQVTALYSSEGPLHVRKARRGIHLHVGLWVSETDDVENCA